MIIHPIPEAPRGLELVFEAEEAALLSQLVHQLVRLLEHHSGTPLDPDPLLASLEVGGSTARPQDPALARLFPDAYEGDTESSEFRRLTEQSLINHKLQDAIQVAAALGVEEDQIPGAAVEVRIPQSCLLVWARTLTAIRLALAARLGIAGEEDQAILAASEDTRGAVMVFDWLGAILETVMQAVQASADLPPHRDR